MKSKIYVFSCSSRQFVLLLDLVESRINELFDSCKLLDLDSNSLKLINEYQEVYNSLRSLL